MRGIKGSATVTVIPGPLASITLTPNPVTLNVGAVQQFTAVGKDATGNVVPMTPVWSLVAGGGTINGAGLFTAGTTPGTYTNTVKVTSGSISSTATVIVTAGPLATITVTPTPATMAIAGTQQFTAVGKDLGGNVVAISPTWTVVAGGGTLSTTGLFTAGNLTGTYTNTVRASSAGIAGFATVIITSGPLASITVTPNPVSVQAAGTQQFIAVGRDGSGNVFLITPVWSVVNGGGTIGSSSGLFTAGNTAGTYTNTIQATSGAISGTATVTVTAAPPPPSIVNLGTAAPNGIMAGTAVTCITGGIINADVSISPGNTITGFGPCVITGVQHLADAVALQGQRRPDGRLQHAVRAAVPAGECHRGQSWRYDQAGGCLLHRERHRRDGHAHAGRRGRSERELRLPGRHVAHDGREHRPHQRRAGQERVLAGRLLGHARHGVAVAGEHRRPDQHHDGGQRHAAGTCVGPERGGNARYQQRHHPPIGMAGAGAGRSSGSGPDSDGGVPPDRSARLPRR